jgi:hypothetical protein
MHLSFEVRKPAEVELEAIRKDRKALKEKRRRLSSISWFMRFLSEKIAKETNKQEASSVDERTAKIKAWNALIRVPRKYGNPWVREIFSPYF